ncbi:Retrovirus-related Pol polyprotein from transposon 297 [Vitis vinifera]|uniref:Retrovirus-related Pol polyprotein from transposon 297 n=1 Tax=Vitis vinifera TaxID=29760 RepID=A0A438CI83_VITVI|nr:Retrovirus-related Pol polyprotein from transposon 297 [Vitis vinifera]
MCGGDDHLAWKHPVSLEACRGLRTAGGAALVTIGFDYPLHSPILEYFLVPSLDSPSWTRVRGRLTRVSDQPDQRVDQRDMDSQVVTVDQFAAAMASIQEAIAGLGQRIDGQQAPPQDGAQYDSTAPPPPPLSQSVPHPTPYVLHSQTDATPLPVVAPIQASEDAHARMDRLEQRMRQMRVSDGDISWDDFDGAPVVSLPTQFRMPEIERYTGIGCPKIHLRLYSSVMRAHGLDEAHLIMLFPMSLSGAAQRWRELEALRQGPDESVTSFISRWREKIAQIVDRPSEKDQISMILRSLQPRFARHLMGFPHTDFGSLVQALYGIEEGIARGLWPESSPSDSKGKKPLGGQRPGDVSAISSVGSRSPRRYQTFGQTSRAYYPHYAQYRPPRPMIPTYLHQTPEPVFAAQVSERPPTLYPRPRAPQTTIPLVQRPTRQFSQLGMPLSRAFQKLMEGGLLTQLAPRPVPQPVPPRFRMDLHCSYHQGPGHDTDHCAALRHAIQDLIDQGLVNLGQPSVTTNPLPAHSTHAVPPPRVVDTVGSQTFTPFSLISDWIPFELTPIAPLITAHQGPPAPFILRLDDDDLEGRDVQIVTRSGRVAQPPPLVARPFDGAVSHEEVRREDDEILRQLQSTQARISIWSLLASSSTHRDALIRALSQIRVETTTTPEGLIHMMTAEGHIVPSVLLDNGSALNVCPLATAIALGYAPSDFDWSSHIPTLFQVLRIPTSFNLLLGRPWIHVAGAIPSSLHQKVKFIHDGQVITVHSTRDIFAASEPVLQISHSEDDLLLTGFTFDEIQTLEIEDFCRDFVAMSFDQHSSTVVLDMMRGMTFLPGMGLGRRQQGPSEFIAAIDHDTTFGLGFIPTEADYRHMARLRKERVRARLSHTPFDYPIRPYRMSLADYFVRGSETRPRLEEIDSVVHTDRETDLQHLFHQLQLSDGAPDSPFPLTITPTSPDRASMLSLCFPEEITGDGVMVDSTEMIDGVVSHDEYRDEMDMMTMSQITSIVQLQPVSAFDMFGVSTIEVFEGTQTLPVPELPEDDSSLFEGIVSPVEGASDLVDPPLSFDVLSGFVSRSDDVSVASFMDLIAWPDSDRDSSDHDSDPVDERVSPDTGDVETVDFGTEDQPRELKIGSPLSTEREIDLFIYSGHTWMFLHGLMRTCRVKEEIQKQLSVGFISVVEYPEWLANVVPVPKKDGKLGHSMLSFMDGFSGATYQRAATTLFHDMMHRDVEVYVDDMIVKSRGRADHLDALERFFERIRKFRLRLNPKKCTFGVTSGKLLGHMVSDRGIEVDPDKIKAILDMPVPRTEKEIRNQPTVWNDDCQIAFEKIKEYLLSPPVLVPPMPGRPLLLYLSVSDMALGCMLAQLDDSGKERAFTI